MLEVRRLSQLHTAIVYLPSSANESTNQQLLQVYLRAGNKVAVDGMVQLPAYRGQAPDRPSYRIKRPLLGKE
jgi:hypothetical protein